MRNLEPPDEFSSKALLEIELRRLLKIRLRPGTVLHDNANSGNNDIWMILIEFQYARITALLYGFTI
jgi:hypothetical protein